jgi:hypothetical protein
MIKENSKMTDDDKDVLLSEVIMRLAAIESLLISKNIISREEYAGSLKEGMDKITEFIDNSEKVV